MVGLSIARKLVVRLLIVVPVKKEKENVTVVMGLNDPVPAVETSTNVPKTQKFVAQMPCAKTLLADTSASANLIL